MQGREPFADAVSSVTFHSRTLALLIWIHVTKISASCRYHAHNPLQVPATTLHENDLIGISSEDLEFEKLKGLMEKRSVL